MAFKLPTPLYNMKTGSYKQSFEESPLPQGKKQKEQMYEYRLVAADGKTIVRSSKGTTPPKWFSDYQNKPGSDDPTKSVIKIN